MIFNYLAILTFCAAILAFSLSVYAWKRRQNHSAVASLAMLFATMTIWNLFYALELASTDLSYMKTFTWFAYTGIAALPVFSLIFAARYADSDGWLTPSTTALLFFVPALTLSMLFTNDLHHLFYSSVELSRFGVAHFQETAAGPFWWIHVAYSYLAIVSGLFIFLRMLFRVPKENRPGIFVFIIGYLFPFAVNITYTTFFHTMGFFDPTPLAFIVTGGIWLAGMFSKKIINVIPVALDTLFTANPDGIIVLNRNAELITANHAAKAVLEIMKCPVAAEPGKKESLFDFNDLIACQSNSTDLEAGSKVFSCISNSMTNASGKPIGYLISLRDITGRKRAEEKLAESETRYRQLVENTSDIIYSMTAGGVFTFVSPAWTRILGHATEEIDGHSFTEFVHPDDLPPCYGFLQKVVETGERQEGVEYRVRHKDGHWRWHTSSAGPVKEATGAVVGFDGLARDITERKLAEQKLEHLASHDSLTGLLNRRAVYERLETEVSKASRELNALAVAVCDIDGFKEINDTHGHQSGDEVLAMLAEIMENHLRPYDAVGRIGGEEFLLMTPYSGGSDFLSIYERLRVIVEETPIRTRSGEIRITVSIGVACFRSGCSVDGLVGLADRALYRAKQEGRNRVVLDRECMGDPEWPGRV